jgi:hypothetical protein
MCAQSQSASEYARGGYSQTLQLMSELNPLRLSGAFAMMQAQILKGHIDESVSAEQRLFTLAAVVGYGTDWTWFHVDWERCIEAVNRDLVKAGRKPISRYHASDCSTRHGDFKDWGMEEQKDLTSKLLGVFAKHPTKTIAYTMDLDAFVEVFPEAAGDPKKAAYSVLTKLLVFKIGDYLYSLNPRSRITLIHDRCAYNGTILESFDKIKDDASFQFRSCLTTIAPMSWEDCRLLQCADLIAYENMKAIERQGTVRSQRFTLKSLLALESFGGLGHFMDRDSIDKISEVMKTQKQNLLW